jgi:hypothetical protein
MAAAVVGLRRGVRDHYSAYIERPDPACGRGYAGWGYKDLEPSLTEVLHHADCICRLACPITHIQLLAFTRSLITSHVPCTSARTCPRATAHVACVHK